MPGTVIVGTQWGDEGKGRFTDYLAQGERPGRPLPGRPQRRAHASSSTARPSRCSSCRAACSTPTSRRSSATASSSIPRCCIAELDMLAGKGVDTSRVKLSGNAHLIMPYHQELDRVTERYLGQEQARHHQARHRPRVRRQGVARRACGCRTCSTPRSSARSSTSRYARRTRVLAKVYNRLPLDADEIAAEYLAMVPRLEPHDRRHRAPRARGARRRPARAVRGRAGHVPRPRPRHVSVRHVVEPDRRRRVHRRRRRARARSTGSSASPRRTSPASGSGPFPTELFDGDRRRPAGRARPRVRHQHRPSPPAGLARRGDAAPRGAAQLAAARSRSPSSTCSHRSPSSRCASPTRATTARATTTCRTTSRCCTRCARSTRRCPGGRRDIDRSPSASRTSRARRATTSRFVEELVGVPDHASSAVGPRPRRRPSSLRSAPR